MTYSAAVTIPYFTGIPEDVVSNVWHFDWTGIGDPDTSDFGALENICAGFYENVFTNSASCAMGPWMRPLLTTIKIFDLTEATPRVPVHEGPLPLTLLQSTGGHAPTEVAVVLSYHALFESGVPNGSRRGRLYIGGWGAGIADGTTTTFPTPNSLVRSQLADAAETVMLNAPSLGWTWVVYSRTLNQSANVVGGWVDNAADTQRRRGQQATVRLLWP